MADQASHILFATLDLRQIGESVAQVPQTLMGSDQRLAAAPAFYGQAWMATRYYPTCYT